MNRDFLDILSAFQKNSVEFLVVGAHALAAHGIVRATGDLDVWVKRSPENAERIWQALTTFGAPLKDLSRDDFNTPDQVVQFGLPPARIDILTHIDAVEFDQAWKNRLEIEINNLKIPVLGKTDLLRNKRATGRPRDKLDADSLDQ